MRLTERCLAVAVDESAKNVPSTSVASSPAAETVWYTRTSLPMSPASVTIVPVATLSP